MNLPGLVAAAAAVAVLSLGCSDGSEADRRGVGAECLGDQECTEQGQSCLSFKGGYCGVAGCTVNGDCPEGSGCVAHTDGSNYCFLVCNSKSECNANRTDANESNCSSNISWADEDLGKACVPPS